LSLSRIHNCKSGNYIMISAIKDIQHLYRLAIRMRFSKYLII